MGSWMQLHSARKAFPLSPDADVIHINDIAHSLSNICRFNGHCNFHYSVAQHSLYVAAIVAKVDPALAIYGLLHDAGEAFLSDVVSPIKGDLYVKCPATNVFPEEFIPFEKYENRWLQLVAQKYGLVYPFPEEVWKADLRVCCAESMQIMKKPPEPWAVMKDVIPASIMILRETPEVIEEHFLQKFYDYMKRIV